MSIDDIDNSTIEGKLLLCAITRLSLSVYKDASHNMVLRHLESMLPIWYGTSRTTSPAFDPDREGSLKALV